MRQFYGLYQADENVLRTILTPESAAQLIDLRRSKDLNMDSGQAYFSRS
jgi:hypothetical protein